MIKVRRMTVKDVDEVHFIEVTSFTNPWSKKSFKDEILYNKKAIYVVAQKDHEVIAYAGMWLIYGEGHITNIAVRKDMRGYGVGKQVTQGLIDEGIAQGINAFTLEVRSSNARAIKIYEKLGFKEVGIRKNYYTNPLEDAVIMWKNIN